MGRGIFGMEHGGALGGSGVLAARGDVKALAIVKDEAAITHLRPRRRTIAVPDAIMLVGRRLADCGSISLLHGNDVAARGGAVAHLDSHRC